MSSIYWNEWKWLLISYFNFSDKFIEIENFLQAINVDLNTRLSSNDDAKTAALDLEVKSMKHIVCETEERCDKLEKMATNIDHNLHHTMQLVADIENHIATQQRLTSYINSRGKQKYLKSESL